MSFIPQISPVPPVAPKAAATPAEPKAKSPNDFAALLDSQPGREATAASASDTTKPTTDGTAAVDTAAVGSDAETPPKDRGKTLLDDLLNALGDLDAALKGDQPVDPQLLDNVNAALAAFANYLGVDLTTLDPNAATGDAGGKGIDPTSLLGQLTQKADDISKLLGAGSDLAGKLAALNQKLQPDGLSAETLTKLGFALEPKPLPAPELATPALKLPESTITKTAEAAPPKTADVPAPKVAEPAAEPVRTEHKTETRAEQAPAPTAPKADDKGKTEIHAAKAEVPVSDPDPQLPGTNTAPRIEIVGGVRAVQAAYQTPPTQVNVPQLAFDIVRHVQAGNTKFHVRLDPPELGRIDVRMDVDKTGNVTTRLTVEKSETLDLLQRDQRSLEKALAQAGLEGGKTNLEFSLRQNPSSHRDAQGERNSPFSAGAGLAANDDSAEPAAVTQYRGTASASGLNLFV